LHARERERHWIERRERERERERETLDREKREREREGGDRKRFAELNLTEMTT
jgi:hypothetical protein